MSTHEITEGSVVVGVDGSLSSESALRWAVTESRRTRRPLHVVHALGTELMLSDKQQLGTKEAPASSDPVVTAALASSGQWRRSYRQLLIASLVSPQTR